ncbi:MAG: inositol monophosphatase family protein [Ignavibacteria bacterium]|jgi:myo-inositol-1(or 4)-monophosphatase
MAKVFFSYSRKDQNKVKEIKDRIELNGHEVWLDEDISAGVPFPQAIEIAIKSCDFMAIFLSDNSKESPWMKREFNAYFLKDIEKNTNTILPIKIDKTELENFSIFMRELEICDLSEISREEEGIRKILNRLARFEPKKETYTKDDYNRLMFAIDMSLTAGYTTMMYYNSGLKNNLITEKDVKNSATLADEAAEKKIKHLIGIKYDNDEIIAEEQDKKKKRSFNIQPDRYYWIIDPLDGTLNFLNRIDLFCTAIGIIKNGKPFIGVVFDPVSNEVFFGMKGIGSQLWKVSTGEVSTIYPSQNITLLEESIIATHVSSRKKIAQKMFDKKLIELFSVNFRHIRLLGCGQLALAFVASGKLQAFFQFESYIWDQLAGAVIIENAGGIIKEYNEEAMALKPWTYNTANILACSNPDIAEKFRNIMI